MTTRHEVVSIVAGGWSASRVALDRLPGLLVGVNEAALLMPRCDVCVSMDRNWVEHRWKVLCERDMASYLRTAALKAIAHRPDHVQMFACDHTSHVMTDDPGVLNGTNSGMCALNLAYQWRPQGIVLVGFDMRDGPNGETHWYPLYPWMKHGGSGPRKLAQWARQYDGIALQMRDAGIKVWVVGAWSALEQFPRLPYDVQWGNVAA